ncbi:MAG: ABC-2 transporter permease [Bacteroidetes bacterium]|nr:ABC-2 transporter permease [Bacteroidota bacterium]
MFNLLYKEFKLAVHPFYYILPVITGALMLIPQWIFFLVPLYFCFITVSNLFAVYKSNNDLSFSIMLPVSKKDIVKARMTSIMILQLLQISMAVLFAILNHVLYKSDNFGFDTNAAFFGLVFVMFALENALLFPMFYKTGYNFGVAVLVSTVAAVLFAAAAELLIMFNGKFRMFMEGKVSTQVIILIAGIVVFMVAGLMTYKISISRFEKVDV